ncbi:MAG TPA: CapA family protein [Albitalea sp.]|nr:CapA family protein [Albitalea sp.]
MSKTGSVTLLLAGDVMTGRGIDQVLQHPSAPQLYESYVHDARDYVRLAELENGPIPAPVAADYIWGEALAEMVHPDVDLRIVNLETAITTSGEPWPGKGIHYRMHPANAGCLSAARIDCCALANNHVLDWGRRGLDDTLQAVWHAGALTAGAGADDGAARSPAELRLKGKSRVLVFAFCTASSGVPPSWSAGPRRSGVALLPDLSEATARAIAEGVARRRGAADRVIVSIHWGENWGLELPPAHREFAHRLIDLGAADAVHGHSSHHPLAVEVYGGKLILYGCGDLINDYEGIGPQGSLRDDVACLYIATLSLADGRLQQLDIVPLQRKRFRLVAADASALAWLERVFSVDGYTLAPAITPRSLASWSLLWPARR